MPQEPKKANLSDVLRWLLPVVITVAAIYFLSQQVDFNQVGAAFSRVDATTVLSVVGLFLLSLVLRVICWFFLLEGKFTFWEAFFGINAGYLLNNVLPFKLGEFGRAALLAGKGKVQAGFMQVLASIITERTLDFFLAATYFLLMLPRVVSARSMQTLASVVLALTVLLFILAGLAARNLTKINAKLEARWADKPRLLRWLPRIKGFLAGFQILLDPIRFLYALLLLAASWMCSMGSVVVLQRALLPASQDWWSVFIVAGGSFANALPAAPANLGVYEAANVALYGLLDVEQSTALAIALILHAVQFIGTSLLGMVGIYILGESFGSLASKASHWRKQHGDAA
ncbi:MAG: flippase-like domain-containing protein [Anaerolineaceae bacterium]|nr:flippase-like domain-containing protein [Anaerolineaceae bacterium]